MLMNWLTDQSLGGLYNWAWVAIALVVVILLIVVIVVAVLSKKKSAKEEQKLPSQPAEATEPENKEGEPAVVETKETEVKEEQREEPAEYNEEKAEAPAPQEDPMKEKKTEPVKPQLAEKPAAKPAQAAPAKKTETATKPAEKKAPATANTAKKTEPAKSQPAAKPAEKKAAPAAKPVLIEKQEKSDSRPKVYHISLRKSDGMWQVKAAGAEKAIKLFKTQAEAIEYCKPLAENQEASIMIHKKDGSFRKLTY